MDTKGTKQRGRFALMLTVALTAALVVSIPASADDIPPNDGPNDVTAAVTTVPADAVVTQQFYNNLSNDENVVCADSEALNADKFNGETGSTTFTDGDGNSATLEITGNKDDGYTVSLDGGTMTDIVLKSNVANNNWYRFTPGVSSASPLFTGTNHGLSHTIICWDPAVASTTLSLDLDGPLTVYAGSSVTLDATETNDGDVNLTNAHVDFSNNIACAGGNQKPDPGVNLAAGDDLDVSCEFTAAEGTTVVTVTGHGTADGKDVTFCEDPGAADPTTTLCDEDEIDQITILGINPSTDLDLNLGSSSPATQTGTDPETYTINVDLGGDVDLSFTETNDGQEVDDTLTNVFIEFVDGAPECVDTAGGVTLAPTDTHTVDCATLTNVMAHRTITAIGHGTDALGNDVTWCEDEANPPAGVLCDQDEIVVVNIVVNFGEGCTPGLWGQYDNLIGKGKNGGSFHWIRDEWAASPYSHGDNAGTAFGVSVWDPYTLGDLTNRGGGGEAALGRAASAALQNILHPDISYFGYPTGQAGADQLFAEVQAAFAAGTDAAIEELKDELDARNNEGDCTLSNG